MATDSQPSVTRAEAENIAGKLQAFREGLPAGEQRLLDSTLRTVQERVSEPSVQELLAEFPDGPALLEDVAGFAAPDDPVEARFTTTTVVTITVTTVKTM